MKYDPTVNYAELINIQRKDLTLRQMVQIFKDHNIWYGITKQYGDKKPLKALITFSNDSWPDRKRNYSYKERTYVVYSHEKYFIPEMLGCSIFSDNLAKNDPCRLDWYMWEWKIEKIIIKQVKW